MIQGQALHGGAPTWQGVQILCEGCSAWGVYTLARNGVQALAGQRRQSHKWNRHPENGMKPSLACEAASKLRHDLLGFFNRVLGLDQFTAWMYVPITCNAACLRVLPDYLVLIRLQPKRPQCALHALHARTLRRNVAQQMNEFNELID